jgi:DNA invertase Pin-like site-specific DNA recombinase
MARRKATRTHRAILYVRVSTQEQADSGAGMGAQRDALEAEIARRGFVDFEWITDEACSGKDMAREGLQRALAELAEGRADTLVAAKVDRLSRSVTDFSSLIDRSRAEGWSLVTLDIGIDTGTAMGGAMATIAAVFGQLERDAIKTRTRDALADKRRQGVHTGRKIGTPSEIREDIKAMRALPKPTTYRAIADHLNAAPDKYPTTRGAQQWTASAVYSIDAANVREEAESLGIGRVGMTVQEQRAAIQRQIAARG